MRNSSMSIDLCICLVLFQMWFYNYVYSLIKDCLEDEGASDDWSADEVEHT